MIVGMPSIPLVQQNFVFSCFANSLMTVDNILGMKIRSIMVLAYLRVAASFYMSLGLASLMDVRQSSTVVIIHALEEYEWVPEQQQPITDQMLTMST